MKDPKLTPGYCETVDFDTAVALTGYGRFHYEIFAVCALCIVTVGFQNGVSSYIFPAAQCELNLSSFELGILNVSFLAGGVLSCFLWGNVADINGRRKILSASHISNAILTLTCATSPHTASLTVCRMLNGFLIGAPGSIIFSYVAEFQPPKYRPASVCLCGLFFTFSWLLLPILASIILPLHVHFELGGTFVVTPWRLFLILLVLPELLVGIWFLRMPESPKFFAANGEVREALKVLRRMYAMNSGDRVDLYPVKNLIKEKRIENVADDVACRSKTVRVLKKMVCQSQELFRPPLVKTTCLTCAVMFTNMFGVFGLGLWFPELFIRFQQYQDLHPNGTITVKELASLNYAKNLTCEPLLDSSVIHSTIAIATSSMLYNAVSGFLSTKIDVKIISTVSMLVGGLSASAIYWLRTSTQNLAVACAFQATMVTANMTVGSIGVELFPTQVAGVALCLIICAGRIGAVLSNIMFGYLMDEHCEVPIFVVAGVVLLGGGLCALIPDKGKGDKGGLGKKGEDCGERDVSVAVIS